MRQLLFVVLILGILMNPVTSTVDPKTIKTMHVVFMTHFDIGYTALIAEVINFWFDTVIPDAISVSDHFKKAGGNDQYVYTAHSWLFSLYLKCPPGLGFHCPTESQVKTFNDSVKTGQLTWHAYPFNAIPELMDQSLFEFGIHLSHTMDDWYGFPHKVTMSQRDEPQATRSMVPLLVKNKILAFSEGSNPEPPDMGVPNIYLWRVAEEGVEYEIIAMQHSGGYGGIDVKDAMMVEGFDQALVFAFKIDNRGAHTVPEVEQIFTQLRKEFPNANVKASTFDAFVLELQKARPHLHIPVVTRETGDTWMNGPPSDPWKMAAFREISRARSDCLGSGKCSLDDFAVYNMSRFLLKCAEHTWGRPGVPNVNWTNAEFRQMRNTPAFVNQRESWAEQRAYINHSINALPKHHPLREEIDKRLPNLISHIPDVTGYHSVSVEQPTTLKCSNIGVEMKWDTFGRLVQLTDTKSGMEWADPSKPLVSVVYSTYDEAYLKPCHEQYGSLCWKPNVQTAEPTRADWSMEALNLWWKNTTFDGHDGCEVITKLESIPLIHSKYGAPRYFYLTAKLWRQGPQTLSNIKFNFTVDWFEKTTTRLPEAIWMWVNPRVQYTDGWSMIKLGHPIDPLHVVNNGSQHLHGVEAIVFNSDTAMLTCRNLDSPVVSPSYSGKVPFQPIPAPGMAPVYGEITDGMNFLLFQNIYTTNFILWYPYDEDEDVHTSSKFRFAFDLQS